MATTKILPVRKRLKDCLDYAANPKKTEIFRGDALDRLMHYTQNEDKTEHQPYVTGFNCDPQNACLIIKDRKKQTIAIQQIIANIRRNGTSLRLFAIICWIAIVAQRGADFFDDIFAAVGGGILVGAAAVLLTADGNIAGKVGVPICIGFGAGGYQLTGCKNAVAIRIVNIIGGVQVEHRPCKIFAGFAVNLVHAHTGFFTVIMVSALAFSSCWAVLRISAGNPCVMASSSR